MMSFAGCQGFLGMGFMGGGMWLYGIITLLIILAAVYLFSNHNNQGKVSAQRILDQEYAKGNVSDADYQKRKANLRH